MVEAARQMRRKLVLWKSIEAWRQALFKKQQRISANSHYLSQILKRTFSLWLQGSLRSAKRRLLIQFAAINRYRRYLLYWRKVVENRKAKEGMKWTAEFVHNQWLLKKCLIVMGNNLQQAITLQIYESQIATSHTKYQKRFLFSILQNALVSIRREKDLKTQARVHIRRNRLKYALQKVAFWTVFRREYTQTLEFADKYYRSKFAPILCSIVFQGFRYQLTLKAKLITAENFSKRRIRKIGFRVFQHFANLQIAKTAFQISEMHRFRLNQLFQHWKNNFHKECRFRRTPSVLISVYFWLKVYTEIRKTVYSPFSTDPLSTDRLSLNTFHLPLAFENEAGKPKTSKFQSTDNAFRRLMSKKVFKQWENEAYSRGNRRKTVRNAKISRIFSAWKGGFERRIAKKCRLQRFTRQRDIRDLENVIINWRRFTNYQLRLGYYAKKIALKANTNISTRIFAYWRHQFITVQRKNRINYLFLQVQNSKYLLKPLQVWILKMRMHQKKRHLTHCGDKFTFQRVLQNAWKLWRFKFICNMEKKVAYQRIIKVKNRKKVIELFDCWKIAAPRMKTKREKKLKAIQWFERKIANKGLKAIADLRAKSQLKKKQLIVAEKKYTGFTLRLSFWRLRTYSIRRISIRSKDHTSIHQIHVNRSRHYFNHWFQRTLLYHNTHYLPPLLSALQLRDAFRRLRMWTDSQRLAEDYQRLKEEDEMKMKIFCAWKRYAEEVGKLAMADVTFRVKKRYYRKLIPYRQWQRALAYERNLLKLFSLAVLRIKDDLLRQCMQGLKVFYANRIRKKVSHSHYLSHLSQKTLQIWSHTVRKRSKLIRTYESVVRQITKSTISRSFYTWVSAAIRRQRRWYYYLEVSKTWKRRTFDTWKLAAKVMKKIKDANSRAKEITAKLKAKGAIEILKTNAEMRKKVRERAEIAEKHYSRKVRKICFERVKKYWMKRVKCCACEEGIRGKKGVADKKRCFEQWKKAAAPALQLVHSVTTLKIVFENSVQRVAFGVWGKAVIKLKTIGEQVVERIIRRKKYSVIQSLLQNSTIRQETRQVNEKALRFHRQHSYLRAFHSLHYFISQRIHQRKLSKTALSHYTKATTQNILMELKLYVEECLERNKSADSFYSKKQTPLVFSAWKLRIDQRKFGMKQREIAINHSNFRLKSAVLHSFLCYKTAQDNKKEKYSTAMALHHANVVKVYLKALREVVNERQKVAKIRQSLFQKLQKVYQKSLLMWCFTSLQGSVEMKKVQVSTFRLLQFSNRIKSSLSLWLFFVRRKEVELRILKNREKVRKNNAKSHYLALWRVSRYQQHNIRKIKLRSSRKVQYTFLQSWRQQLYAKYITDRRDFRYKLLSFQSILRYQVTTLRAKAIFRRVKLSFDEETKQRMLRKWRQRHSENQKSAKICNRHRLLSLYFFLTSWRKVILINNAAAILSSQRINRVQEALWLHWKTLFHRKQSAVWRLFAVSKSAVIRLKRFAIIQWQSESHQRTVLQRLAEEVIKPGEKRVISLAFFGWRYVARSKRLLQHIYQRYQKGRNMQRKWQVFRYFAKLVETRKCAEKTMKEQRTGYLELVKQQIFQLWARFAAKKVTLRNLQTIFAKNMQKHCLERIVTEWVNRGKTIEAADRVKEMCKFGRLRHYFSMWRGRLSGHSKLTAASTLSALCFTACQRTTLRYWHSEAQLLSLLQSKSEYFLTSVSRKQMKCALYNLKLSMQKNQKHEKAAEKLIRNWKKRAIRLFVIGCRIAAKGTLNRRIAIRFWEENHLWKILLSWKLYILEKSKRAEIRRITLSKATEHSEKKLLFKAIQGWKEQKTMDDTAVNRSKQRNFFQAWKTHTHEMSLLHKYLHQTRFTRSPPPHHSP